MSISSCCARRTAPKLLIGATRISDAGLRIFSRDELTVDCVLASACLPLLQHSVEIDGEHYWDGGYVANPPLTPLVVETEASTVLIVQISPKRADIVPRSRADIERRIDQINFCSTLDREIDAIRQLAPLCASRRRLRANGRGCGWTASPPKTRSRLWPSRAPAI